MDDPRVQAMFKRSRQNKLFFYNTSRLRRIKKNKYAVMVISIIYLSQTNSEMLKIFFKIKLQ